MRACGVRRVFDLAGRLGRISPFFSVPTHHFDDPDQGNIDQNLDAVNPTQI
jgi:hypothetical protein